MHANAFCRSFYAQTIYLTAPMRAIGSAMSRALTFQQVEAFQAVMQRGTTTSAAVLLNTTQPSVSRRIAQFEHSTGLKLFDLHRGRLRPTSEGLMLYRSIEQHFSGLKKIESVAAALRSSGTGILRIGCTPTLGVGLVPAAIARFRKRYPTVHIDLHTHATPQLVEYHRQDLFDLVLTTGKLDGGDLEPRVIGRTRAVCVLPPGHPLRTARRVDLRSLAKYPLVSLLDTNDLVAMVKALMRKNGIDGIFAIETTSSITVCALVAAGSGVGIVNPYVASTYSDRLVVRDFEPAIEVAVTLAMPTHAASSALAQHFAAVVTEHGGAA